MAEIIDLNSQRIAKNWSRIQVEINKLYYFNGSSLSNNRLIESLIEMVKKEKENEILYNVDYYEMMNEILEHLNALKQSFSIGIVDEISMMIDLIINNQGRLEDEYEDEYVDDDEPSGFFGRLLGRIRESFPPKADEDYEETVYLGGETGYEIGKNLAIEEAKKLGFAGTTVPEESVIKILDEDIESYIEQRLLELNEEISKEDLNKLIKEIRRGFLDNFFEAYQKAYSITGEDIVKGITHIVAKPGDRIEVGDDMSILVELGDDGNFVCSIERNND